MKKTQPQNTKSTLPILRSGDPKSQFGQMEPAEILKKYGLPRYLLGSSLKTKKSLSVGVLAKVLFLTPGVFCSHATPGCLAACLGHSSGRMQMPTHANARDRRTALYIENRTLFLQMLTIELSLFEQEAQRLGLTPAVRLNGSSDIPWERLHPELFQQFPNIRFFDYTKNPARMNRFLQESNWPRNYHLTVSAQPGNRQQAHEILENGGTVAVVFTPTIPQSFWSFKVVEGDEHDARFLDPQGSVIGLTAKGKAKHDQTGFTVRISQDSTASTTRKTGRRQSKQADIVSLAA
jgi:hypothetical protein